MKAIDAYYEAWSPFDERKLGAILAPDLDFEGPIAGRRQGSAGVIGGVRRFVDGLQSPIEVLQRVESETGAAVIYEAEIPKGRMRFAEFFRIEDGRIQGITLLYDPKRYIELGGK